MKTFVVFVPRLILKPLSLLIPTGGSCVVVAAPIPKLNEGLLLSLLTTEVVCKGLKALFCCCRLVPRLLADWFKMG